MTGIRLIVGLGNPGGDYEHTRHNAGFWFTDALARQNGATLRLDKSFQALTARVTIAGAPVWLCEPQTFMNRSGMSVAALAAFYKISASDVLVVHDELDFLPGTIKLKLGGSAGGHNGLKDIAAQLGTQNFWRMRIGIGHPRSLGLAQEVVDFVLHKPNREQRSEIDRCIDAGLAVIEPLVQGQPERAMQQLHSEPVASADRVLNERVLSRKSV